MSKKFNLLNKIQEQREIKLGTISLKAKAESNKGTVPTVFKLLISTVTLVVIILVLLGFNLKLFSMVKGYSSQKADILNELSLIKEKVNNSAEQVNTISHNIEQLSTNLEEKTEAKVKEIHTDIKQLRDTSDAQGVAIENLTKAKNTLFNRLNSLEIGLGETKKAD